MAQFPANIDLSTLDGSERLQAQRRGGGRPERLLGGLGRRRQWRRLRRPDRRRPVRRSARQLCPARAMWCSARRSGFAANLDLSSLDGSNGFRLGGVAAGDYSGCSVASAGDVNGDGFADLIVGAPAPIRTAALPARAMWCSARRSGFAANLDLVDASTAATASGSAARRPMTTAAARWPRPATSTATASPT